MSTGISVSGAVSGLDTASMVTQLVAVEASQQNALKTRQTTAQKAADAYATIITSLKDLSTKAKAVANTAGWQGTTATSTAASVTATTSGTASGSLTFDVDNLAAAHSLVSANTVASTAAIVASGGSLTIKDKDGNPTAVVPVGSGSLSDVVAAINSSDAGLRASAVQTSPGNYRLQVTGKASGTASEFSVDGLDGFSGVNVLSQGADAQITVGTNPLTKYTVTSSSNTFAGVVPGMSFTVAKSGETNVTVESKVDGSKIAESIKGLVDSANTVLTNLSKQTAYDTSSKSGGALFGENSVKQLQQQVLSAVGGAGAPGVSLTRDGKLSFDATKFGKAYEADPVKTATQFGISSSFTPAAGVTGSATVTRAASITQAGTYAVKVAVTAAREQWRMDPPGGDISGQTVVIMQGSKLASYTAGAGENLADAVAAMNTKMSSSGLSVSAAVVGGSVMFNASSPGTSSAFNVTMNGAAATKTVAGRDAAGTIDDQPATGSGSVLSLGAGAASTAAGIAVDVNGISDADVAAAGVGITGTITYKPGLAQSLSRLLDQVTDTTDGALSRAKASRLAAVKDLQTSIDSWDLRLEARRASLTRQFTAMETAIASLQRQTSALSGL